jgi:hypothetical protein
MMDPFIFQLEEISVHDCQMYNKKYRTYLRNIANAFGPKRSLDEFVDGIFSIYMRLCQVGGRWLFCRVSMLRFGHQFTILLYTNCRHNIYKVASSRRLHIFVAFHYYLFHTCCVIAHPGLHVPYLSWGAIASKLRSCWSKVSVRRTTSGGVDMAITPTQANTPSISSGSRWIWKVYVIIVWNADPWCHDAAHSIWNGKFMYETATRHFCCMHFASAGAVSVTRRVKSFSSVISLLYYLNLIRLGLNKLILLEYHFNLPYIFFSNTVTLGFAPRYLNLKGTYTYMHTCMYMYITFESRS